MEHIYRGKKYIIYLEDDGTMDTVISINGIEHRLNSEDRPENDKDFTNWILEIAENIIETDERYWN